MMATQKPVGSMCCRANYGSGSEDVPKYIRCVDGGKPQIREVWTFRENGVTHEVHLTECKNVGAGSGGEFSTDRLTPNWGRVPMF